MPQDIKEIKHFRDALKDIHFDTWLVLDLDNTVMLPRRELHVGGDPWFGGLFAHLAQNKLDQNTALPWLMSVYNAAQDFVRTEAVEPEAVKIIKALQDIGIPVLGLTARGYSIRQQTLRQLIDMGIDFSRNSLVQDDGFSCAGGVIFCSGQSKGERLNSFFTHYGSIPNHVGMLDDKREHLERVQSTLEKLNVHFNGSRYAHLDEQVKQFDMEQANIQLAHLWEWLPEPVQENIKKLHLIPEHLIGRQPPSELQHVFFHPEHPLQPLHTEKYGLDKPLAFKQSKFSSRSMSTPSFFHREPENRTLDNGMERTNTLTT